VERRVVTAFFVDVVGSTELTVQLGPERFKRALDRAFVELRALIEGEHGTVANVMGDAIFVLFGLPTARPDDPQRALRAAHACIRWAENHAAAPVPLTVRIGVETGEVIVDLSAGDREGQQKSIGTCVNLAARLQQQAEPGQILVGTVCHQVTCELAEFADMGNLNLKGLGNQHVWRLVSPGEPVARARPPLVGRESEMARLRSAFARARRAHSVFFVISGPPGQGKTRLVEEFLAEITAEAFILQARCRPAAELTAHNPLRELLSAWSGNRSVLSLAENLSAFLPDALERNRVSTSLAHSAGLIASHDLAMLPTSQRQDEIENGWRRYLAALGRDRPVVIWIDDIHWGEPEAVRLLQRITIGADLPILVLATARPEFMNWAEYSTDKDRFLISLQALAKGDAQLLARWAGSADPMGIERAEGNPLFIIELALARKTSAIADLPITLKGIIGARLDELATSDRELLQSVAVVGETFTTDDGAFLSGRGPDDVAGALDRLAALAYLRPVPGGFRFHHALIHDVAYGRLAIAERMRLHARYARGRASLNDAETTAHHFWEAVGGEDAKWVWDDDEELSRLRRAAHAAHLAAARRYADRFACELAVEACQRASQLAIEPEDRVRAEQATGSVFATKGDLDQAWAHYLRAREWSNAAGLRPPTDLYPSLLEPVIYTSGMFFRLPDEAHVEALLCEGEGQARSAGDMASLARLIALRAYRSMDAAQMSGALQISEAVTDPETLGSFLEHVAILQNRFGDFAAAERSYERLDRLTARGVATDRQLEFRAILALNTGDLEEARSLAARYLAVSASRGPHLRTHAYREQCHVLLAEGNWRGLRDLAQDTDRLVSGHPETAFCYAVSTMFAFAAVACAVQGNRSEAEALLSRAEAPLQAEPLERESVLLLASASVGRSDKVVDLLRIARQKYPAPLWYFTRMEAVVLAMLEQWDALNEVLLRLERIAAVGGSKYIDALVAAIREEMNAAEGGPAATHGRLRELGYLGWSHLLSHRPAKSLH
jgi:class 3 adenylate cyclase